MREVERLERAVDEFADLMKKKLRRKHRQGYGGWESVAFGRTIVQSLLDHAARVYAGEFEEAVDVANLAMFVHHLSTKENK